MRGARIYYPRVPRLMRDDHRRISSRCVRNRNSSCTTSLDHTRYKTLPARPARRPTRYKTLPAARLGGPPGTKLSQQAALAGPPGTKLSQQAPKRRFRPTFRMQGELCTASATNNPSRENFIPHAVPLPVQNSPSTPGSAAHPVQNSPSKRLGGPPGTKLSQQAPKRRFRPTFRMQGELCTASATNTTSREKKVTHQHPTAPTNAPLPKFRMQFD